MRSGVNDEEVIQITHTSWDLTLREDRSGQRLRRGRRGERWSDTRGNEEGGR
jgi:hypothetical protein